MHPIATHHAITCADHVRQVCANPHPTFLGGILVILFILLVPAILGASALASSRKEAS